MVPPEKVLVVNLDRDNKDQKLLDGQPQTCGMRSGKVHLDPGQACGQHSTKNREEMLVFLSGKGLLSIEAQNSFQVGEGKVAYIPPNTVHNVKNTNTEPLVYIYCVAPVGAG